MSAGGSTCNSDSGDVREQEFENSRGTSCLPDECWDREFCSGFNGYWCEGEGIRNVYLNFKLKHRIAFFKTAFIGYI